MQKQVSPTEYRLKLRERILEAASREFFARGIKAVKMDDIANVLSISKRTLYEIYTNKEELLMETIKQRMAKSDADMKEFVSVPRTVIDILLHVYKMEITDVSSISPLYIADLQKYPQVIEWLRQRHDETQKSSHLFFQKGVEQGYFREDVDFELVQRLADFSKDHVVTQKLYEKYTLPHIFHNVVMLYFRGLCTAKGIAILDEKIKEIDANV